MMGSALVEVCVMLFVSILCKIINLFILEIHLFLQRVGARLYLVQVAVFGFLFMLSLIYIIYF